MINKLEKQFFQRFGIEPKKGCTAYDKFTEEEANAICNDKCAECSYLDDVYPKITDHILLELIRLGLNYDFVIHSKSKDELKEKLLVLLIRNDVEFKQQVQALFKEAENE